MCGNLMLFLMLTSAGCAKTCVLDIVVKILSEQGLQTDNTVCCLHYKGKFVLKAIIFFQKDCEYVWHSS